jgi:protoheme IX farnesyltransferase
MINKRFLKDILVLTKPLVSLAISFTSFAGFVVASREVSSHLFLATLGVLLMASGVSSLNQVLERKTDALMERTKNRPVASGRVSSPAAAVTGITLLLIGFIVLFFLNAWAALLGLINAFWYLAVYTPLKRTSVSALLVGTITGALPLIIGFVAANTGQAPGKALFLSFFLVLWQVAHFLLLVHRYGKEYEKAGLASLTNSWEARTIVRVALLWIVASGIAISLIPYFGVSVTVLMGYLLFALSAFTVLLAMVLLMVENEMNKVKWALLLVNLTQVILMILIVIDALI